MKALLYVNQPITHLLALSHLVHHDVTVVYTEKDARTLAESGEYDLFVRDFFFLNKKQGVAYPVGLNLSFAGGKELIPKGGHVFTDKDVSSVFMTGEIPRAYNSPDLCEANPFHGDVILLKDMSENDTQEWEKLYVGFNSFVCKDHPPA